MTNGRNVDFSNYPMDFKLCSVISFYHLSLNPHATYSTSLDYLDGWNYFDDVNVREFRKGVTELLAHVDKTLGTPYDQRGEPDFT